MEFGSYLNKYARVYSPYMGKLVNHLPMVQVALYSMYNDLDLVKSYTNYSLENMDIDKVRLNYEEVNSIEDCLGKRELYEACLDLISKESKKVGIDRLTKTIVNKYDLGLSSGLFHPIIRLSYAIDGRKIDESLDEEIERALAYYITSYRESKIFTNYKTYCSFEELESIFKNPRVNDIISNEETLGRRLRALYDSKEYMELGFLIDGSSKDKIISMLQCLIPIYNRTRNIVVLHCITGLHAIVNLRDYFEDFNRSLDIASTAMFTHVLSIDAECKEYEKQDVPISWAYIFSKLQDTKDPHSIKLIYSTYQLEQLYNIPELRIVAINRLNTMK